MFAVCMGKQCKSVFRHCDLGRAKSSSTRGSGSADDLARLALPGTLEAVLTLANLFLESQKGCAWRASGPAQRGKGVKQALNFSDNLRGSCGVFAVCMGKQCKSVFRHCDLGRAKSLSTRGSGHVRPIPTLRQLPIQPQSGSRIDQISSM